MPQPTAPALVQPTILDQGKIGAAAFAPTSQFVQIQPAIQPAIVGPPMMYAQPGASFTMHGPIDLATLDDLLQSNSAGGLPLTINFMTGSTMVSIYDRPVIALAAAWAATYPNVTLLAIGMASPPGGVGLNQDLGQRRAESVAAILSSEGLGQDRIETRSFGLENPATSGQSPADWYGDQRVVIVPGIEQASGASARFLGCPEGPITQSLCDLGQTR